MHLLVTLAFSTLYSGGFHVPHDPVDDVAVGPNFRTGTGYEIVLCQNASAKVSHSYDEGLTWEVVGGDKLQQFHCTQVEYFPNLVRPLYFIGTTDGVWTYDPQS
ncbi:MAG: hypothetical protein QGH77_09375, partial [Planctomycetota bacterium]|nr:hypothetical protein [Planctomycetota bacterium]